MSSHPDDPKAAYERVSLGGDARQTGRRSGFTLSRSGHVATVTGRSSGTAETGSAQKTGRRAVRPQIKSPPEAKRKD